MNKISNNFNYAGWFVLSRLSIKLASIILALMFFFYLFIFFSISLDDELYCKTKAIGSDGYSHTSFLMEGYCLYLDMPVNMKYYSIEE